MTEEQIAEICGVDSTKLAQGPTLQELNEEDPKYIKRDYDHRQQVVVGSVVMLCVAIAMVLRTTTTPNADGICQNLRTTRISKLETNLCSRYSL